MRIMQSNLQITPPPPFKQGEGRPGAPVLDPPLVYVSAIDLNLKAFSLTQSSR